MGEKIIFMLLGALGAYAAMTVLPPTSPAITGEWEYLHQVSSQTAHPDTQLTEMFGKKGWQLVAILPNSQASSSDDAYILYFKRRVR